MMADYSEPPYRTVVAPRIGGLMQVPAGYWHNPENVRANLEWLMKKEQISFDDNLPRNVSLPLLKKHGLNALVGAYQGSTFKLVDAAYPGKFHEWQFRHNGNRIWTFEDGKPNYELCRQAVKWLVEEKLGLNAFYSGTVTRDKFNSHGLGGMLTLVYHGSPRKAVDDAYPQATIKKYNKLPNGFWKSEKGLEAAIRAVRRMVERERIPLSEIPERLTFDVFRKWDLEVLVSAIPSRSHIDLIRAAYPQFKPSDFPNYRGKKLYSKNPSNLEMMLARMRVRDDGNVVELGSREGRDIARVVVRELMRLEGLSNEEAQTKLTKGLFIKYQILKVFKCLGGNTYNVVSTLYPEKELKPWQIRPTPSGYWNGENGLEHAAQATRWLVEDVLKMPEMQIPEKLHQQDFVKHGLSGMMHLFNGSTYATVNNAYPSRFKEWEIRQTNMWQGEKGKEVGVKAVKWLVDHLGLSLGDIPKKLTRKHFAENGLGGCLSNCFGGSLYLAISQAFPMIPSEQLDWMLRKSKHLRHIQRGIANKIK